MAIIIDYNAIGIANLMGQIGSNHNAKIDESLIRHVVLTSILSYKKQFGEEYGKVIIACDSKNYWRKTVFPYYKANRKKMRDASKFDWKLIFDTLSTIKRELKEYFPYHVLEIDGTEADDVIATLCKYLQSNETAGSGLNVLLEESTPQKILIISGDQDFLQLQKYKNVRQYSPIKRTLLKDSTPELGLIEKVIRGDTGDGIPNILSSDDTLVTPDKKQKSLFTVKVNEWLKAPNMEDFCTTDEMKRNYIRNNSIINLSKIPEEYENKIIEEYKYYKLADRKRLFSYFVENRLKLLLDSISDF